MGGREEGFEAAGDDEERDGAGDELDGFGAGEGKGVAAAEYAGKQDACAEAETGGSGEHDGWDFERAVGGHEAEQAHRHVVLRDRGEGGADREAVLDEEKDGADAAEDAENEGVETDHHVVGHDEGRSLRLGTEDALGPELVTVEIGDALGA